MDETTKTEETTKAYQIEVVGPCKKKIAFSIPVQTIKSEYESSMRELISHAQVPGFRKGKVPRSMLEKKYQHDLLEEVKVTLIQNAYQKALEDSGLKPLEEPHLHEEAISIALDKPMEFHLVVEVEPEFELQEYKDIEVEVESKPILEDDIEKRIKTHQKSHQKYEEKTNSIVEAGDSIEVQCLLFYEGDSLENQANIRVEWGEKSVAGISVEGLTEKLAGKQPGDEISFSVNIPEYYMPADHVHDHHGHDHDHDHDHNHDHDHAEGAHVGEMKLKINKVSKVISPEITEAFVKEHFEADSVEAFRNKIRKDLEDQKSNTLKREAGKKAIEKIMEGYQFEIPTGVLEKMMLNQFQSSHEMNQMLEENEGFVKSANREELQQKVKELFEKYKTDHLETAKKGFREHLVLKKIAKKERVYVTEQEVEFRVRILAQFQGLSPEETLERFKESGQLGVFRTQIQDEKTIDLLGDRVKIKEIFPVSQTEAGKVS